MAAMFAPRLKVTVPEVENAELHTNPPPRSGAGVSSGFGPGAHNGTDTVMKLHLSVIYKNYKRIKVRTVATCLTRRRLQEDVGRKR